MSSTKYDESVIAALAKSNLYLCTTTFFKDPNDPEVDSDDFSKGRPWKPYMPQVQLYNCLDYGYDIVNNVLKPTHPAEMIVMVWPRQYGKTEGVASAIAGLAVRNHNAKIGVMSNNQDNAQKLVNRIAFFIRNSMFRHMIPKDGKKIDRIRLTNDAEIYSFGKTENIRGNSLWWLFVDEAAQFDDALLDGAALPTVRAAGAFRTIGTPSIVLLSTPRGPVGRFYDYYMQGLENREIGCRECGDKRHIGDSCFNGITFGPRILPPLEDCPVCGANNYEYVSNHILTITLDPYNHPTRTPEEIDRELELRGNTPLARQELLGEITTDDSGVFRRSWLEEATDPNLHNDRVRDPKYRYVISADFGKMHDATVICIGHLDDDRRIVVDYIYHMPAQGGMDYAEMRYHLMDLVRIYAPSWLVLDSTGIGDPIVEQISMDLKMMAHYKLNGRYKKNGGIIEYKIMANRGVRTRIYSNKNNRLGYVFDYRSKVDLIDNLVNQFERQMIRIPPEYSHPHVKIMWKELINFGFSYSANNRILYGTQRGHDDCVIGVALLAWGLRERPYFVSRPSLGGRNTFVL